MMTALIPQQKERLAELHREWLAVGNNNNTGPLDRNAVTGILAELYRRIGKAAPLVLFFSSPAMCFLAWARITEQQSPDRIRARLTEPFAKLWDRLPEQLDAQIREADPQKLRESLAVGLASALRTRKQSFVAELESQVLGKQLSVALAEDIGRSLASLAVMEAQRDSAWPAPPAFTLESWGGVRTSPDPVKHYLRVYLEDQVKQQNQFLHSLLGNCFAQDRWSLWERLYLFYGEIGAVRYSPDQAALLDLYFCCSVDLHWWLPFDGVVLVSERLHAAGNRVVSYCDGWNTKIPAAGKIPEDDLARANSDRPSRDLVETGRAYRLVERQPENAENIIRTSVLNGRLKKREKREEGYRATYET